MWDRVAAGSTGGAAEILNWEAVGGTPTEAASRAGWGASPVRLAN